MWHSRVLGCGLFTIGLTLCLGWLGAGRVHASPVYPDERSLSNGAQLYELHCSECHGRDTADSPVALNDIDAMDSPGENSDRIVPTLPQEEPRLTAPPTNDDWPEWAERPDPGATSAADARAKAMNEIAALINDARQTGPDSGGGNAGPGDTGSFIPVPGATNLADPQAYFNGTSEEELFDSIANGTGAAMPAWHTELGGDEPIWDLVNYIRSFWSEEWLY